MDPTSPPHTSKSDFPSKIHDFRDSQLVVTTRFLAYTANVLPSALPMPCAAGSSTMDSDKIPELCIQIPDDLAFNLDLDIDTKQMGNGIFSFIKST